jgi:hypothetical protein
VRQDGASFWVTLGPMEVRAFRLEFDEDASADDAAAAPPL